jgi:hypothetical protein
VSRILTEQGSSYADSPTSRSLVKACRSGLRSPTNAATKHDATTPQSLHPLSLAHAHSHLPYAQLLTYARRSEDILSPVIGMSLAVKIGEVVDLVLRGAVPTATARVVRSVVRRFIVDEWDGYETNIYAGQVLRVVGQNKRFGDSKNHRREAVSIVGSSVQDPWLLGRPCTQLSIGTNLKICVACRTLELESSGGFLALPGFGSGRRRGKADTSSCVLFQCRDVIERQGGQTKDIRVVQCDWGNGHLGCLGNDYH